MTETPLDANPLPDLVRRLLAFRDEREWGRFHTLKDLLLSLSLEAAEMLELAQWRSDGELTEQLRDPAFRRRLEEEAADVFLYLLLICEKAGIDLPAAAVRKIELNAARYPADKARGSAAKYDQL